MRKYLLKYPDDLYWDFRRKCTQHRRSMKDVFIGLMRLYVEDKQLRDAVDYKKDFLSSESYQTQNNKSEVNSS